LIPSSHTPPNLVLKQQQPPFAIGILRINVAWVRQHEQRHFPVIARPRAGRLGGDLLDTLQRPGVCDALDFATLTRLSHCLETPLGHSTFSHSPRHHGLYPLASPLVFHNPLNLNLARVPTCNTPAARCQVTRRSISLEHCASGFGGGKCEERGAYKMTYQDDRSLRRSLYATNTPQQLHPSQDADVSSGIEREFGHTPRHEVPPTRIERRLIERRRDDMTFVSPMAFQSTFPPGFIPFNNTLMSDYNAPHCSAFHPASITPQSSSTDPSVLPACAPLQDQGFSGGELSARSLPSQFSFTSHQHAANGNEYMYPPMHAVYGGRPDVESADSMSDPGSSWAQARAPAGARYVSVCCDEYHAIFAQCAATAASLCREIIFKWEIASCSCWRPSWN
jgi:hypothetical protein